MKKPAATSGSDPTKIMTNLGVLNSTATGLTTAYSSNMTPELNPIPIVAQGLEDRWAVWQARADADDRATKRKLFIVAAILICSAAILNGLWLLQ